MFKFVAAPFRAIAHRLESKVGKHVIRKQFREFATDRRTLDLGCGRSPTADGFPNRVGVDVVPDTGVQVIADAHALPFSERSFEQIICSEVLEHLYEPARAAREMARVLQKGGLVALTVPFVYPVHEAPHDYQRFTSYGLRRLFVSSGFDVQQVTELFTEEQTLAILLQRVAFQRRDATLRHYVYLLLAHLLFRLPAPARALRYQDVSRKMPGPFLTATYLLVARKI